MHIGHNFSLLIVAGQTVHRIPPSMHIGHNFPYWF